MTGRQGRTWSGQPARSEEDELKNKSRRKGGMGEIMGSDTDGSSLHPTAKDSGYNGGSNVGEDEQTGSEGIDPDPVPDKE